MQEKAYITAFNNALEQLHERETSLNSSNPIYRCSMHVLFTDPMLCTLTFTTQESLNEDNVLIIKEDLEQKKIEKAFNEMIQKPENKWCKKDLSEKMRKIRQCDYKTDYPPINGKEITAIFNEFKHDSRSLFSFNKHLENIQEIHLHVFKSKKNQLKGQHLVKSIDLENNDSHYLLSLLKKSGRDGIEKNHKLFSMFMPFQFSEV
jgi:hypothetical protein